MDSLGNVTDARYYSMNAPSCGFLCRDLMVTSTNDVIAWGEDLFFALRVDAAGDVQWAKWFGHREGGIRFFKELPGGDVIAGINMDTAGAVVARFDAAGNFLWCKSYIRPKGIVSDCLVESDDSFIITGYTDSLANSDMLPSEYHPKLFIMNLNGAGDVQWCKGYDNAQYLWYAWYAPRIVRALDGNYVVLGNLGYEGWNYPFRPFLMKTDHNGDTLWTRSAGRLNHSYVGLDLLSCADGGYAYTISSYDGLGEGIFKTDSLGRLPCYNRWNQVVVADLFPVDSSFTLTSIDGAEAHPAYVTSVACDPTSLVPGCSTTMVPPVMQRGASTPLIRPNPNTGHFTIAFQDPLMAETYYSVYDALGKLLYQRPLAPGKTTEEVDLSRFGTGTYVIRCTDPGGVSYERVVVE
ncbi:MAG: T9SS type A sorting domain-containing protein [Flavobacteriales bacterium]|nr:T9SS type A sorting domain-containing protein [Flavobacteriales bacterium]MCC6936782.1 T9SS type A sorting domain-containing protein [Flavobacteriales bacterium]